MLGCIDLLVSPDVATPVGALCLQRQASAPHAVYAVRFAVSAVLCQPSNMLAARACVRICNKWHCLNYAVRFAHILS